MRILTTLVIVLAVLVLRHRVRSRSPRIRFRRRSRSAAGRRNPDLARLPDTRGMRPANQDVKPSGWARINNVRDLADGRRFVNDSRGLLYLMTGTTS